MGLFASKAERDRMKAEGHLLFSILSFARAAAHEMPRNVLDDVMTAQGHRSARRDDINHVVEAVVAAPQAKSWRPLLQPGQQWIAWHYTLGTEPGRRYGGTWLAAVTKPGMHRPVKFLDEELAQLEANGYSAFGTVGRLFERVGVPVIRGLIRDGDSAGFRQDYLSHVRSGATSPAAHAYTRYRELNGPPID